MGICNTEFIHHNLKTEFVRHNLVHKTEFVDNNLKFAKQMTKNKRSEFDDRIGIVHRICTSQFSAQNRICGQQFEVHI